MGPWTSRRREDSLGKMYQRNVGIVELDQAVKKEAESRAAAKIAIARKWAVRLCWMLAETV